MRVPITFFAHQAPVLPMVRRWPHAVDGVALVTGSMAPDLAYVLNGSRFDVWAHGWPGLLAFCVPVTVGISWVIARVLAPVVPCHLPMLGAFRLQEFRGLACHRFRLVPMLLGAFLGAFTHVALDHVTHEWGWFARQVAWYREPLVDAEMFGRRWTPFRMAQYVAHFALSAVTIWWLWRAGSRRWLAARAAMVPCRRSTVGAVWLVSWVIVVGGAAAVWVALDRAGSATDIVRVAAGCFVGLTAGALSARVVTPSAGSR